MLEWVKSREKIRKIERDNTIHKEALELGVSYEQRKEQIEQAFIKEQMLL
ncbi:hypothetical protein JT198_08085 [Helicobacter pylori]|nr:hypothetical protein [Helicobacter pylori]